VTHVKRLLLLVAIVAAAVCASAIPASADNGATTTHFNVSYTGGAGALLTCAGERIVKSGPNGYVKDSESCTTANPQLPVGRYDLTPDPNPEWYSDYEYFVNPAAAA